MVHILYQRLSQMLKSTINLIDIDWFQPWHHLELMIMLHAKYELYFYLGLSRVRFYTNIYTYQILLTGYWLYERYFRFTNRSETYTYYICKFEDCISYNCLLLYWYNRLKFSWRQDIKLIRIMLWKCCCISIKLLQYVLKTKSNLHEK